MLFEPKYFPCKSSSLLTGVLKKAQSEKWRATFGDLFTVLNEEPECYGTTIKLMEIALTLPLTSCSAEAQAYQILCFALIITVCV
jgi:hypothetical protein